MALQASPTKLRDGSWGARVRGNVNIGDTVTITTKSGKSWDATVTNIVWTGKGASIVATRSTSNRSGSYSRRSSYQEYYCGYPCPVTGRRCCAANGPCHDCE